MGKFFRGLVTGSVGTAAGAALMSIQCIQNVQEPIALSQETEQKFNVPFDTSPQNDHNSRRTYDQIG